MTTKSRDRLEQALQRIADPAGEGARTFLRVYTDEARRAADAADDRAARGMQLGPLDGRIVSIKDLFDVAGETTLAASVVRKGEPPATKDAPIVERLRKAGAVIIGKTNMTEFAFSGLGLNPHYGTPGNPKDRSRVPGGSSSGAGVSVADGMCEIAIGTDTGGSVRIPAAFSGVVGFKPTAFRVPREGAFPLSYTLDSIGPLANSVEDCRLTDAVMADVAPEPVAPPALAGRRFVIPEGFLLEDMEPAVARAFEAACAALKKSGASVGGRVLPQAERMREVNAPGGIATPEAYYIHRDVITKRADEYDPNVRARILRGASVTAADYIGMQRGRDALVKEMDAVLAEIDALILPTSPVLAPHIAPLADADAFTRANLLVLRNPAFGNFFDLTGVSLPLPVDGPAIGLMLLARRGSDARLLALAASVERLLA